MATTKIRGANNGVGVSQISAGTISNADIHASAAIALSKLAEAVIQADGGQAFTAAQSMGGFKLTNLADGTAPGDAVNKSQLDAVSAGLDPKASVKVATTTAGTYSSSFANGSTIDGYTLVTGDRILIKDQATASENGIHTVNASGAPSRATDSDGTPTNEVTTGNYTFVELGTVNKGQGYVLYDSDAADPSVQIVPGTDTQVWTQFSASTAVTISGTTNRITVTGGPSYTVDIAATYVGQTSITTLGTIGTGTWNGSIVTVPYGGTGATTFTTNGVLYGNGSSAIQATAASSIAGAILTTPTNGGAPSFTTSAYLTSNGTNALFKADASTNFSVYNSGTGTFFAGTIGGTSSGAANFGSGTASTTTSGAVALYSGVANTNSGNVEVYSGNSTTTDSGTVTIYTGNAAAGNSGDINLQSGTASGSEGKVKFIIGSAGEIARVIALGFNLAAGTDYFINGTSVLNSTTLGSTVVNSSLTSVGTIGTGTWQASTIGTLYGGTGLSIAPTSIADGDLLIGSNSGDAFVKTTLTAGSGITITNGAGSITIASTGSFGASNIVTEEIPSGTIDGSNDTFTIANTPYTGTVRVYLNGIRQRSGGNDYSISGTTITFTNAPQTGDILLVDYFK